VPDDGEVTPGQLVDLTDEECWRLLASGIVGRIAWVSSGQPFVVPVNFTIEGKTIYIHTSPYSTLVQEVDDSLVAFQVDDIDVATRSGSTAVAQGRARLRYADPMTDRGPDVDVWPSGAKAATIAIEVRKVSGRGLK
jgi:nitroimidazol reductase NimA-like FMN-containing flavoprotein (pyridoxamine 5'-phosphate oxidase superfamily)